MSASISSATLPRRVLARGSGYRTVLAPVVFGLVLVGLWQLFVTALDIEPFIVPSPAAILAEFIANFGSVVSGALQTGLNALVGLVVGAVLGVLAAILANLIPVFDGLAGPAVAALAVMPIVALAPVLYTMYGADVDTARQLVAGLAVLIPVYINTLRGLRQVRAVHRDLMRAFAATPRQQQLDGDAADRGAVRVHRVADRVVARGDLGSGRGVLRRAGRRAGQVDHLRGREQQLPAGLGVRAGCDLARPRLLRRRTRAGDSGEPPSRRLMRIDGFLLGKEKG